MIAAMLRSFGIRITDEDISQFEGAIPGLKQLAMNAPALAQNLLDRFEQMELRNVATYQAVMEIKALAREKAGGVPANIDALMRDEIQMRFPMGAELSDFERMYHEENTTHERAGIDDQTRSPGTADGYVNGS